MGRTSIPLECTGALLMHRQMGYTATHNYAPSGEHKQRASLFVQGVLTGYTPGVVDAIGRLIAANMQDYAGTIIVEPRPGAAGRFAVEAVKAADPDGTAILLAPLGFIALFPHIYRSLRYQPRDFIAVSTVASSPTILTIGPKVPAILPLLPARLSFAPLHAGCRLGRLRASPKLIPEAGSAPGLDIVDGPHLDRPPFAFGALRTWTDFHRATICGG